MDKLNTCASPESLMCLRQRKTLVDRPRVHINISKEILLVPLQCG
jgi:hypothetical protein